MLESNCDRDCALYDFGILIDIADRMAVEVADKVTGTAPGTDAAKQATELSVFIKRVRADYNNLRKQFSDCRGVAASG